MASHGGRRGEAWDAGALAAVGLLPGLVAGRTEDAVLEGGGPIAHAGGLARSLWCRAGATLMSTPKALHAQCQNLPARRVPGGPGGGQPCAAHPRGAPVMMIFTVMLMMMMLMMMMMTTMMMMLMMMCCCCWWWW